MATVQGFVQLGALDGPASRESTTCYENKLGGFPDWPPQLDPRFDNKCPLCGLYRPLILQCYAPLENSPHHRTLYIFACINSNCWNKSESWSCMRVQYKSADDSMVGGDTMDHKMSTVSNTWCSDANDWEDDEMNKDTFSFGNVDDEAMDDISNDLQNLNCSNTRSRLHELKAMINSAPRATAEIENDGSSDIIIETPSMPDANILNVLNQRPDLPDMAKNESVQFTCMYIKVYPEYLDGDDDDLHANDLLMKYQKENGKDLQVEMVDEKTNERKQKSFVDEEYEKGVPLHGNAIFHSFLTRIKINPEQIVRYSLGGQPLLISNSFNGDSSGKCRHCSSELQFELQLLPTMIPFLKLCGSEQTHLEFGNVIVYSCKNSCWSDNVNYRHETVIVQSESA